MEKQSSRYDFMVCIYVMEDYTWKQAASFKLSSNPPFTELQEKLSIPQYSCCTVSSPR